jgi:amino acid transporter
MVADGTPAGGGSSPMTLARAVSLGIGAMVGAGIFALLGEVGAVAGSTAWLAFLGGGVVALLNGYSYGRLGARYPSAGGPVDYLTRGYGVGVFAGGLSLFYYAAGVIGMAMVARAFGSYAAALIVPGRSSPLLVAGFAGAAVVGITLVNVAGSTSVGKVELFVVAAKLIVLALFVVGGVFGISSAFLSDEITVSSPSSVIEAIGFAFFAYTGFGVITNAAGEMSDPARELPRALAIAISLVIILYLTIAVVAFGSLSVAEIVADKETALAVAAEPVFGRAGFVIMSVAAMMSTLSALNAALYGSTNVSYVLAKEGELPDSFERRRWRHAPEGLFITAAMVLILATVLDLSQVASLGGLAALLVYVAVGVGHLRLRDQTGARTSILVVAVIATAGTAITFVARMTADQPVVLVFGGLVLSLAFGAEVLLRRRTGRVVAPDRRIAD